MLCFICILLPVSNSYLTDSHWKWFTLPFTPTFQPTSLPHSTSLSTKPRVNSAKSTPTPSRTEQSVQSFNPFKERKIITLNHSPISHYRSLLSKTTKWIDRTVIKHIEIVTILPHSTQNEMGVWAKMWEEKGSPSIHWIHLPPQMTLKWTWRLESCIVALCSIQQFLE